MSKKLKERVNPFKGGIGSFNMPMSADRPNAAMMSGYNGTPGSADSTFARKSSVPLNQSYVEAEEEDTEDLLLDVPDEMSEEDSLEEFSGAGAIAGYTGPLQAPKNPEEFYKKMNIYNESNSVKLTRSHLRKIILEEIKKILQ